MDSGVTAMPASPGSTVRTPPMTRAVPALHVCMAGSACSAGAGTSASAPAAGLDDTARSPGCSGRTRSYGTGLHELSQ